MNYKACLFDFDYTLVDSSQGIIMCFRNVLDRRQLTNITDNDIRRTIGLTLPESFCILTGITDQDELSAMQREYTVEADIHMNANTILYDETLQVLTFLKNKGVKIGIVSNKYRFRIENFLKAYFPPGFFDVIIGGEDVINHKPSPEGIIAACKKLKCKPKHVLYVGDSVTDTETAKATGVDFVAVLNGTTTAEEMEAFPHLAIISNLEELIGIVLPDNRPKNKWLQKKRWVASRRLLRIKSKKGPPTREINYGETVLCKNCEHEFIGNFCNRCGQGTDIPRFKFKSAVRYALDGMVRIERGFLYTLVGLLYRPGYLINDFISGKRVRYSSPFQTLFILAACYVLLIQLVDPSVLEKSKKSEVKDTTEQVDDNTLKQIDEIDEKDEIDEIDEFADKLENLTDRLSNTKDIPIISNFWKLMKNWAHGNKAASILLTLPVFALSTRITFLRSALNRHYNYAEHIIVQAYIASQILLVSMLLMPFTGKISWGVLYNISNWSVFALFFWDYKQLFGNSWWKTFIRTFMMFLFSFLIVISLIIIVVILAIGVVALFRYVFV